MFYWHMCLNSQPTQYVARGNSSLQLLVCYTRQMKWVLLQDLTYVIPQMEPEQKDAFTSSKINLVECPHFKVVLLHQGKWLVNTKHFKHITVKRNKQPKVGVVEEARRSHVERKHKKQEKKTNNTSNISSWLQHRHNEKMSGMALNSQLKRGAIGRAKKGFSDSDNNNFEIFT